MKAPAVEMSLTDPVATHDQERSLVQRLFKAEINTKSIDQAYAYIWPHQRLTVSSHSILGKFSGDQIVLARSGAARAAPRRLARRDGHE